MLFLDLAKAYDSVEYWALEDAMRGIGIPENALTVMRNLDERAQAKVPDLPRQDGYTWAEEHHKVRSCHPSALLCG